jgi:hypothetical protein
VKSLALAVALLLAGLARAEPYAVASHLPALELPDQHGAPHALDPALRAVVFSRDMGAGQIVKDAIAKTGPELFVRNNSVYVVDLAGMSAFVRRWFAMPGLRRKPYRILVDDDGTKTSDFPAVEGRPTVLLLENLRVARIEQPASADALLAILEPAAR